MSKSCPIRVHAVMPKIKHPDNMGYDPVHQAWWMEHMRCNEKYCEWWIPNRGCAIRVRGQNDQEERR